jgi:hypothetical protein
MARLYRRSRRPSAGETPSYPVDAAGFDTDVFATAAIEILIGRFRRVLDAMTADVDE